MPDSCTRSRVPAALAAGVAVVLALAPGGAAPARAQASDFTRAGALATSDPTYNRPYLYQGACYLSSIGSAVRFDVHEFRLDDAVTPADLAASLCSGAGFDSVLFLYQRSNGAPGGFNAAAPCTNLVLYNDDYCGSASRVSSNALALGHVTVVVTSFENGETGAYTLTADSAGSQLQDFIFYSGFETADTRTWTFAVAP